MKTGPSNRVCWPLVPGTGRVVESDPARVPSRPLSPLCDFGRSDLCVRASADSSVYCALRRSRTLHLSCCILLSLRSAPERVNDRRRAFKKFISLPFFISLKTQQNCESWNLFEPCLSGCSFVWAFLLSLSYSSSSFSSSSAAFGGSSNFGRFSDFRYWRVVAASICQCDSGFSLL